MKRKFDAKRLKELILYIALRGEDDPKLGAVKLNKILFYADRRAYLELGKSITGAQYQHLQEGPAPRELVLARREMIAEGSVVLRNRWYVAHTQTRLFPLRPPDLGLFDAAETLIVEEVMADLSDMNGDEVSRLSHQEWAWRLTDMLDEMPERMAWLSPEPLTESQISDGQDLWRDFVATGAAA